ncbi:MAG: DegV family protein [Dehalococcoidia bacterium]|nr:DegV family protein [Dehalococcoidia bacterium]
MGTFTIVVDSNCDLPPEYVKEHGFKVLPMPFSLDGREHNLGSWQEISSQEYYAALRRGSVAKTTLINHGAFVAAFSEYAKEGREALFIILSSGLSATYQNAETALQEVRAAYPGCGIHIIDCLSATSGHGFLAMLAANRRAEGFSAGETAAWLEEKKHVCFGLFTVDDLMYLHRGGRLSKFSAVAGSMLGVKPLLNIAPDGTLKLKEKVRGRKAALQLLASQIKRSIHPDTMLDTIMISHTDCFGDAQMFAEMIKAAINVRQVLIMMTGPVIGAHLGPGAIAVVFEADMTRTEYERKYYG